jgi:hypothetical protein
MPTWLKWVLGGFLVYFIFLRKPTVVTTTVAAAVPNGGLPTGNSTASVITAASLAAKRIIQTLDIGSDS